MLLSKLFQFKKLVEGCKFGIEIEMEGSSLPREVLGFETKKDGSLRGESYEYVFNHPKSLENSVKLLNNMETRLLECQSIVNYSFRTSTHVHMNVSDMETNHILNIIYLYLLLEDVFVKYAGRSREGNRFCLRLKDAEGFLDALLYHFKYEDNLFELRQENLKYASVNIAALRQYGSLEFRALAGTHSVEKIKPWLEALQNLRTFASEFENPLEIYNKYVENSNNLFGLVQKIFEKNLPLFEYKNMHQDVLINASLSISIPFELQLKIKKEEDKPKKEENEGDKLKRAWQEAIANPMNLAAGDVLQRMNFDPNFLAVPPAIPPRMIRRDRNPVNQANNAIIQGLNMDDMLLDELQHWPALPQVQAIPNPLPVLGEEIV